MPGTSVRTSSATQRVTLFLAVSAFVFALVQIVLGASPMMVAALLAATVAALAPIRVYGLGHIVGVLFFVLCLYFAYNALLVPTLVLRPADVELFVPEFSAAVVLLFSVSAAAGALAVRLVLPYLPKLAPPIGQARTLRQTAVVSLALGLLGFALVRSPAFASTGALLTGFLYLAFTFEVAATLTESNRRRSLSILGVAILGAVVLTTIMVNSKAGLFATAGAWAVTNLAYGRRIDWRLLLPLAFVAVAITYLFLAINLVRGDRDDVSGLEMILMTIDTAAGLLTGDPQIVAQLEAMTIGEVRNPSFYSVTYFQELPVLVERFVMLPYVDAILRSMNADGPFAGASFVTQQFGGVLPSFLNPGKEPVYIGNTIAMALGLGGDDFNAHPTMGMAAELFYADGFMGVAIGSAALFFLVCAVLTTTVGPVIGNPFGAFVVVRYVHFLVVGTSMNHLFFVTRQLPLDLALVFAVALVTRNGSAAPRAAVSQIGR